MAYATSADMTEALHKMGFTRDFTVRNKHVVDRETGLMLNPERFKIIESFRFEGASDPGDNEVVYALESHPGMKGILSDAYGVYADRIKSQFIEHIEILHRIKRNNPASDIMEHSGKK